MCLIVCAWQAHPEFPLVLGANRDEFFARPTLPAAFWPEQGDLLAGRDLRKGGTWLGVTRNGRIAAVTNYRDGLATPRDLRSRGQLVADYLGGDSAPDAFLGKVAAEPEAYDGFNLIVGDRGGLHYYSNRNGDPQPMSSGVHGLSNALLDTPWPKVNRAKCGLLALLDADKPALLAGLFALLADESRPADPELPATGVSLDWERLLSSAYITSATYGTRCSTVLLLDRSGHITFVERNFEPDRTRWTDQAYEVEPSAAASMAP
jgi:uncharacterized protein with NRDE domain